jgi:hypothetical protein
MRDINDPGTLDLESGRLLIGYARVSTDDQDVSNQRAELHAAGCTRIFAEHITGSHAVRLPLYRQRACVLQGAILQSMWWTLDGRGTQAPSSLKQYSDRGQGNVEPTPVFVRQNTSDSNALNRPAKRDFVGILDTSS